MQLELYCTKGNRIMQCLRRLRLINRREVFTSNRVAPTNLKLVFSPPPPLRDTRTCLGFRSIHRTKSGLHRNWLIPMPIVVHYCPWRSTNENCRFRRALLRCLSLANVGQPGQPTLSRYQPRFWHGGTGGKDRVSIRIREPLQSTDPRSKRSDLLRLYDAHH